MPSETDKLRRPLFVIAYVLLVLAFCLEIGADWFGKSDRQLTDESIRAVQSSFKNDPPDADTIRADMQRLQERNGSAPGYAIPYLGFADGILLLSMTWMLLSLFIPQKIQGRLQGIITFVVALLIALLAFVSFLATLAILGVMLSLFLAAPFGTLTYFAIWGFFGVGSAKAILSISMVLKIIFAILLILSNQRFLKVKSMIFLIVVSLVLNFVSAFLIGMVPSFLASITDAIAGIVNAIAGLILALLLALFSISGIVRALRVSSGSANAEG